MNEKISIIIPIYQVEDYLEKCINSAINQTYKNIEIILVDDGSKDNCPIICDNYAIKDNRVKVIHKENEGLSEARNKGIESATGVYLYFLDSDDWIEKNTIEYLYVLLKNNDADIAECQYENVYEEKKIQNEKEEIINLTSNQALNNLIKEKQGVHVVSWNKLYKKELFENIRFPKGKIHEDEYTTYKVVYKAKKIVVTNQKLCYYRQRKESIISEAFSKKRLDVILAYDEKIKFYKEKGEEELYRKELSKFLYILMYCYYNSKKAKFDRDTLKYIKVKFRRIYRVYNKENKKISKEKIKYTLLYVIPNLVFILPIL